MQYLHPPFYMYEGVAVIPDYSDPLQFYYFPNRPHLAVDEQGRPAIRFLIFKENLDEIADGDEHAVGFLVFDTSLAWPDKTLDKVARKIHDDLHLDDLPRLAPLLYKSGTVRLVFLDRVTKLPGETQPGGGQPTGGGDQPPAEDEHWVSFLEASGVPSLYGENRAIFSAMLTKKATALLFGAFEGFMPAGVIYNLTFQGMQRAFNVHASADWEQVYKHLSEKYTADFPFFTADIEKSVDDLVDKKIIKIEASEEGVGEEGMESEFNAVRKEIQEFVLDKFFKPVPNPNKPADTAVVDGIVDTARRLRDLGSWGSVGYSRIELTASELRTIDIDYTVAKAVERNIAPQAHLSLFFEDYNLKREQVVTVVNGEDALWRDVEFDISVIADFTGDGIQSVGTDVYYGLPPQDHPADFPVSWAFLFDKDHSRIKRAAWYDPNVGRQSHYRYKVFFAPTAVPGPDLSLSSGWHEQDSNLIVISPAELYRQRRIEAQVIKDFPFDRYSQIHAHMRYTDPQTGWIYEDSKLLDQGNPRLTLAFRIRHDAPPNVEYLLTFLRHGGGNFDTGWQTTTDDLILIDDPLPQKLIVQVLVAGDRSKIDTLIVELKYEDLENNIHEFGNIIIDKSTINARPAPWVVPLANPEQRRYWYKQTLIDSDSNATSTGWVQEEKTTLLVGNVYMKSWEVQPKLVGPPLTGNGLESIKLNLHYKDVPNNYTTDKQIIFSQPGQGESWQLQLKDASARDYTYEVIYVLNTGFERKVGPLTTRDTFLIISSIPPST